MTLRHAWLRATSGVLRSVKTCQVQSNCSRLRVGFKVQRSLTIFKRHLKQKYSLKTLDDICINNSVSCMRRIVNTAYISKLTNEPTGVWCTQFTVDEVGAEAGGENA